MADTDTKTETNLTPLRYTDGGGREMWRLSPPGGGTPAADRWGDDSMTEPVFSDGFWLVRRTAGDGGMWRMRFVDDSTGVATTDRWWSAQPNGSGRGTPQPDFSAGWAPVWWYDPDGGCSSWSVMDGATRRIRNTGRAEAAARMGVPGPGVAFNPMDGYIKTSWTGVDNSAEGVMSCGGGCHPVCTDAMGGVWNLMRRDGTLVSARWSFDGAFAMPDEAWCVCGDAILRVSDGEPVVTGMRTRMWGGGPAGAGSRTMTIRWERCGTLRFVDEGGAVCLADTAGGTMPIGPERGASHISHRDADGVRLVKTRDGRIAETDATGVEIN